MSNAEDSVTYSCGYSTGFTPDSLLLTVYERRKQLHHYLATKITLIYYINQISFEQVYRHCEERSNPALFFSGLLRRYPPRNDVFTAVFV